ncbi:MAG: efflux transporter outer membrane subunit [Deltaproteobacteria bacterium]|jgi:Cu(I)/Ag(I) efflux system outer membrane protein|nr:efflux transporter outer membrane subunit [Deltaproteobacteria bacterium]
MRFSTFHQGRVFFGLLLLISAFFFGACSLAPEYRRPASPVPENFHGAALSGKPLSGAPPSTEEALSPREVSLPGVEEFLPEPRLRALVSLAFQNNRDLKSSALAIEEALSRLGLAQAERLPALEASLRADISGSPNMERSESYRSEIMIPSFELDFFGKFKNASLSARESLRAAEESHAAFKISLVKAVTIAYLEERLALQKELLAENAVKSYRDALGFMENRVISGEASPLELEQARGQVEFAVNEALRERVAGIRTRGNLELLTGDYGEASLPAALDLLSWEPRVHAIPPRSEILLSRPDVAAAERALIGAHYDIGAARAAFFPSISLTAALGYMSPELDSLIASDNSRWSLGPGLNLPLFKGGRNQRNLELAYLNRDKLALAYEKAIQSAFKETADALRPREDLKNLVLARGKYLETRRKTLELAMNRYLSGAVGYLEVLEAQRGVFDAEKDLLEAKADWIINSVNLYAALGGGADSEAPAEPER